MHPDSEQPACVLHVSGKTARLAGVVQTRRDVVSHADAYAANVDLSPHDAVACLASPGSTNFVTNLLGVVLSGASLEVLDPRQPVQRFGQL